MIPKTDSNRVFLCDSLQESLYVCMLYVFFLQPINIVVVSFYSTQSSISLPLP